MRRTVLKSSFVILLVVACKQGPLQVDLLIKSGTIVDGSGGEAFLADIAISGDTIVFIGNGENVRALETIDASGLIVSPGFIDPHTHSWDDLKESSNNHNINYLTQGVTTVFNGNDGDGPADLKHAISELNPEGIGTNTAFFIGHGSVREAVMGREDRTPLKEELDEMKALVGQGMRDGALGFSTGLYYAPGSYAKTGEIIALTKEIVPFDGVYDTHIRDESTYNIGLLAAIEETIEIGRQSGSAIHFAHIKALGVDVWGKSTEVIERIETAQAEGMKVTADQYPWQASGTNLQNAVISRWVMAGGDDVYYNRLKDPALLPRIRREIKENIRKRGGAEALLITADYVDTTLIGLNLQEIAQELSLDPVEATLAIARNGGARVASFNMSEEDIANFMTRDWVMTSSDGTKGHPRKYASFPKKYWQYVHEKQLLTLPSFVHKSSGLVARTFGLKERGLLKVGYFADVIVWDADQFIPKADFSNPEEISTGIRYVFVNGSKTIDQTYTGALSGRVLLKN